MKIKKVVKALVAVVDSAEDEGCDGCYTVSAESIDAARKLLERYHQKQGE